MKSNVFNLLAVVCIVLALAGALAIRLTQAQALDPLNGSVIQGTTLGAAFTYQGRLTDAGGDPVPGPCDFQFSLWDDGLAGSQVGSTQTKSNVTLENGYFSAALDFGAAAFQGEARYLQVAVSCPAGSGSYTPLSGRVELTAAPYALGLRPGAIISGNSTGNILSAQNSSSIGGGICAIGAPTRCASITEQIWARATILRPRRRGQRWIWTALACLMAASTG